MDPSGKPKKHAGSIKSTCACTRPLEPASSSTICQPRSIFRHSANIFSMANVVFGRSVVPTPCLHSHVGSRHLEVEVVLSTAMAWMFRYRRNSLQYLRAA